MALILAEGEALSQSRVVLISISQTANWMKNTGLVRPEVSHLLPRVTHMMKRFADINERKKHAEEVGNDLHFLISYEDWNFEVE